MNKKLSKCVIVKGRYLLKKLKIDFKDFYIERTEPLQSVYIKNKGVSK